MYKVSEDVLHSALDAIYEAKKHIDMTSDLWDELDEAEEKIRAVLSA